MNLLVHFVIYGHSWCFESSQIALAYSWCNIENFQNITPAHKSRNILALIRFLALINLLNKDWNIWSFVIALLEAPNTAFVVTLQAIKVVKEILKTRIKKRVETEVALILK